MPETSIVIKSTDRYSENLKKMATATKAFTKDIDSLEDGLRLLSKNKVDLKLNLSNARKELNSAEKQFKKTRDEADRLALELAQANYDEAVRQMKLLTSTAKDMETQLSKSANQAGMFESIFSKEAWSGLSGGLAQAGLYKMAGEAVSGFAGTVIESAIGQPLATLGSSVLSGIATGAASGAILGAPGAMVGAAIGGLSGALSGYSQIYESQDSAYKSWYSGLYENAGAVTDTGLSSGSSIAGSREQTRMAFAQRMGEDEADAYLERVKTMATSTNYSYDEITGYSKLLLNTYDGDKTLRVLQALSDASAGLDLDSSDVNMFIKGLSRMRTTGKTTQEYLDYFSERGVDVYQALSNATGADKSKIADMVTGGKIGGADAAEAILAYINETYGGLSEKLATTYDAMVDNLADVQADIDSAMGEGYNAERGKSIAAQIETYGGELGTALSEANTAIGAGRAALENLADAYTEEALAAVLTGKETALDWSDSNTQRLSELAGLYQTAMEDYNNGNAEAGVLVETYLEEARALAEAQYDSSDAIRAQTDAENDMISAIRENTAALTGWKNDYETSQNFTKGLAAGIVAGKWSNGSNEEVFASFSARAQEMKDAGLYATGIDYVPYDNFPALLHQGERVQTAVEARSEGGSGGVQIVMNGVTIREDADIDRVAAALLQRMELAGMRG